jgi:hypothetical protein
MTPYHYSIVRCRDASVRGEYRNVGLLVMCPTTQKAWLRKGALKSRAHLVGDEATFVRALLDQLLQEAKEVVRVDTPSVLAWLKDHSRPSEDSLTLSKPAIGVAASLEAEVRRLRELYLGKPSGGSGRSVAERLRDDAFRSLGLADAFAPREFPSGPVTWKYPHVAEVQARPLIFNALTFKQTKPENVLNAAFHNVGRLGELTHFHGDLQCLTVAVGPSSGATGRAFRRACEVMNDGGLRLIDSSPEAVSNALGQLGLVEQANQATA